MCFYFSPLLFDDTKDDDPPSPPFRRLFVLPSSFPVSHLNYRLNGITKVVRGLVCAYNVNRVLVCNICTRETMWLPDSSLGDSSTVSGLSYHLGYDPVNGVYKLLKVSVIEVEFIVAKRAQILTLGRDSSWRNLDMSYGELSGLSADNYLCKGALYWVACGKELISFNLNTEKSLVIQPPPYPDFTCWSSWFISQFKGRLVVSLPRMNDGEGQGERLILYALDNYNEDDGCSYWSKYAVLYPPGVVDLIPVGNLPTGHILFIDPLACQSPNSCLSVYSCDPQRKNNNCERFIAGNIPYLENSSCHPSFRINYINLEEENIEPLDVLFGKH